MMVPAQLSLQEWAGVWFLGVVPPLKTTPPLPYD